MISSYTLMLIMIVISISCELQTYAFYIPTIVIGGGTKDVISSSSNYIDDTIKDRPLLRKFKQGIQKRIRHSSEGINRNGQVDAYKSAETFPCLNMQSCTYNDDVEDDLDVTLDISSRTSIRKAFTESSRIHSANDCNNNDGEEKELLPLPHGRSSGSGCTIIRLTGSDASSIKKLTQYGADFYEQVDDTSRNNNIMDAGVFTIADHIVAGYDDNVNDEGKMQFLDTRILPNKQVNSDPLLLPLEVGELVGEKSLGDAHEGMNILLDIGTQITSAILDMDSISADKLIDDGTHVDQQTSDNTKQQSESTNMIKDDISNSYHRLIRYLKPKDETAVDAAFKAHYDSSFLTLIPMPKLPGLEVWCPSNEYTASTNNQDSQSKGEWVRPKIPVELEEEEEEEDSKSAYIIVLAGEFLQLTSDGQVPTCIHRVIPPSSKQNERYIPRISSPMFLRPRRGAAALLSVSEDLKLIDQSNNDMPYGKSALYFQEGLLEECDGMQLWAAH